MFPLFDLPPEAVELVHGFVDGPEDKRALRLVCKRSRALLDRHVVAVDYFYSPQYWSRDSIRSELPTLVKAPWQLLRLDLHSCGLKDPGAASLAAAHWPHLQELGLAGNYIGPAGAASLAAARWPALQMLSLNDNDVGNWGAASLAAARWPALQELGLQLNLLDDAGAAALAAAHWPALRKMWLFANHISRKGFSVLQTRWPTARIFNLPALTILPVS